MLLALDASLFSLVFSYFGILVLSGSVEAFDNSSSLSVDSQMVLDERYVEEPQMRTPPVFDLKPEPVETGEGEPAKFLVKVGGYPRPRVSWWINGSLVVSVSSTCCFSLLDRGDLTRCG